MMMNGRTSDISFLSPPPQPMDDYDTKIVLVFLKRNL